MIFVFIDFSASAWASQLNLNISNFVDPLAKNVAQLMLESLGLDAYMNDPGCKRTDPLYQPSVNGWNNSKYIPSLTV